MRVQGRLWLMEREVLSSMTTSKKQVLKRLLSMALVVVLCLSMLPVPAMAATAVTLTNGKPVTEENVLALIEEYRDGTRKPGVKAEEAGFKSYTNGSTYDAYDPTYYLNPFGNGKECAKFAFAFWDDIFGADVPMREITNPADVRPGDLLRFSGHWAVATSKASYYDFRNVYIATNVGGGSAGSIGWGDQASNVSDAVAIYTRYPN